MNRENNYLEEFLLSAKEKIDDLSVSFEPRDTDDYKYLVVDFEKTTYKISRELVFNFCNIYHKLNRDDSEEVEEEVNPYKNLGSIKEKKLIIESNIIQSEDGVSELLEKIISKIYEKYNFLILPKYIMIYISCIFIIRSKYLEISLIYAFQAAFTVI